MDYEKGTPRNLVQFSEYNDLAFTDTGVQINDNAKPNKNIIWSSDKIERRLNEMNRAIQCNTPQMQPQIAQMQPQIAQMQPQIAHMQPQMQMMNPSYTGIDTSHLKYQHNGEPEHRQHDYYPNGYRAYWQRHHGHHHLPRVFRPSYWLSYVIPSRRHYCDKCVNYLDHTWSTVWNDDPNIVNKNCSCTATSKCNMHS